MDIFEQIKDEMRKVYLEDLRPILVAYSGGKDSSCLLTLLWDVLIELPLEKRVKPVHIITSDTGVETPAMSKYVSRSLMKIERKAKLQQLPIEVHLVKPKMKNSFWVKVLGRGTLIPTPNTRHRFCTDALKIKPTQDKIRELIAASPVQMGEEFALTLMTGSRNEESAKRRLSIAKFEYSKESLFARHSDFKEVRVYHPLKYLTSDELWLELLNRDTLPFGVTVEELTLQYGEEILECGIKSSSGDQESFCGGTGGRVGCWTCGMVSSNDPMLLRYIAEGKNYEGLLEWKNLMLAMRNDIRYREVFPRQQYNRMFKTMDMPDQLDLFNTDESTKVVNNFETYRRAEYEQYAPGGMTFEGRKILLEHLLYIQERDGHSLISEDEIQTVLDAWKDTEGICIHRSEISPKAFKYDGELVFLPNKTINKKLTKNKNKVFFITVELNKKDTELYLFMKARQKANQTSLFFFPAFQEFKEQKLVWNKVTFVVCKEGITSQLEATEHVYKWLGWQYGRFTEETKKAALNHLILSALSEGL